MSLRWKERDAIQVKYSTMVCGFAMTRGWAGPGQACPGMPQEVHMNVHTWRHWACIGLNTHSQREGGVAIERLTYMYVHVVCMCMHVWMDGCYVGRGRKNTEGAATEPAAEKVVHTGPRQRNKKGAEGGRKVGGRWWAQRGKGASRLLLARAGNLPELGRLGRMDTYMAGRQKVTMYIRIIRIARRRKIRIKEQYVGT